MQSTYDDALSSLAAQRLLAQYGLGAKRYGAVASWITILKTLYFDFMGNPISIALYKAKHPAQLHYGFWDRSIHSLDSAINNATQSAFNKLANNNPIPQKIIHFGSGFGGAEILLCKKYPHLNAFGITIDKLQFEVAQDLSNLYNLSDRIHYLNGNFLNKSSFNNNKFDGGMAIESLCHVPENQFGILWKTINQVLTRGARFVVHDWFRETGINEDELNKINIFLKGWDMPSCSLAQTMIEAAVKNNFKLIEDNDVTDKIIISARKYYRRALVAKPFISIFQNSKIPYIQSLGLNNREIIDFANTCLIQKQLFEDAIITYRQLVFEKI